MLEKALLTAGDLMTGDVAVVRSDASLRDAVRAMAEARISGIPVVDSDNPLSACSPRAICCAGTKATPIGRSTGRDAAEGLELAPEFLKGILEQNSMVRTVMSASVITVTEDTPAREVAQLMYTKHIKRVPVMRDGKLVGIVSRSDLIRALSQRLDAMTGELAEGQRVNLNEALRRAREEGVAARARRQ